MLTAALDAAAGGTPTVVVIEGEAGIGKTTLLDALAADAARRGWAVARGRGVEGGLAPALWPWVEILRATGAGPDHGAVAALVAPDESSPAVGSIAQVAVDVASALAEAAATQPRLVLLDDLHWVDTASSAMLALVAERLDGAPVVIAAGHRPLDRDVRAAASDDPLAGALAAIARLPATVRIDLSGLDREAVGQLMATLAGTAPTAEEVALVHHRTGGNPLFVGELSRLAAAGSGVGEAVPAAVRDVVRRRLARLPERGVDLLVVAAVLGEAFDLRVLARTADRSLDDCLDDLDVAVVTRLLVPGEAGTFRFAHALVRDAVVEGLSPLRLARLHQRAADAIEEVHGADGDHAEPIGIHRRHALAVEDPVRVGRSLMVAGDTAGRRGALERADELLEWALEAASRGMPGPERAQLEIEALESVLSIENLRSFMGQRIDEIADRIDVVAERHDSDVARQLARITRWSKLNEGRAFETGRLAEEALVLAERSSSPYVSIMGLYMAGVQDWLTGQVPKACEHFRVAVAMVEEERARPVRAHLPPINVPGIAALAFATAGDTDGMAVALDALGGWAADRPRNAAVPVMAAFVRGLAAAILGDAATALRETAVPAAAPEGTRLPHYSPVCTVVHGWARVLAAGDVGGAGEATAGMAELDAGLTHVVAPMLRTLQGEALLAAGEIAAAADVLAAALAEADRTGERWWVPETLRLQALVGAALGRPAAEVARQLDEAAELADAYGEPLLADRARGSRQQLPDAP